MVCGVARIGSRYRLVVSFLHTIVNLHTERQCCRSRIEHISKRFFVLRHILDTRRKNVHIVNDSTVRQCHIDHRRSWVKRPSCGGRASSMSILNDGWVRTCQIDVHILQHCNRDVSRPYLHHQKTMSIFKSASASMRWLNVTVCGVARIQYRSFMSTNIVAAHYDWLTCRAAMLRLQYWTSFKMFLCTSTYT